LYLGKVFAHISLHDDPAVDVGLSVPTWWGICHGWAPYAVTEPQAKQAVERTAPDGTKITFYPGDIEALMSLVYTNVDSKFVSQRCNRAPEGGYGTTVHTDNGACEQKTAGTANETCTFKIPAGGGTYTVRAKNEQAGTVVTVTAEMLK
jgi:hypothetical protein